MSSRLMAALFVVFLFALPVFAQEGNRICYADRVYTLKCGVKEKDKNGKETGKVGGLDCPCVDTEQAGVVNGHCVAALKCHGDVAKDKDGTTTKLKPFDMKQIQDAIKGNSGSEASEDEGPSGGIKSEADKTSGEKAGASDSDMGGTPKGDQESVLERALRGGSEPEWPKAGTAQNVDQLIRDAEAGAKTPSLWEQVQNKIGSLFRGPGTSGSPGSSGSGEGGASGSGGEGVGADADSSGGAGSSNAGSGLKEWPAGDKAGPLSQPPTSAFQTRPDQVDQAYTNESGKLQSYGKPESTFGSPTDGQKDTGVPWWQELYQEAYEWTQKAFAGGPPTQDSYDPETKLFTAYGVCEGMAGGCNKMEGPPTTYASHLDSNGKKTNDIYTLDGYVNGKYPYVTVAGPRSDIGETGIIPEITYRDPQTGELVTAKDVPYEVADTGSPKRFPDGGNHYDVPLTVPPENYGNTRAIDAMLGSQPFSNKSAEVIPTDSISSSYARSDSPWDTQQPIQNYVDVISDPPLPREAPDAARYGGDLIQPSGSTNIAFDNPYEWSPPYTPDTSAPYALDYAVEGFQPYAPFETTEFFGASIGLENPPIGDHDLFTSSETDYLAGTVGDGSVQNAWGEALTSAGTPFEDNFSDFYDAVGNDGMQELTDEQRQAYEDAYLDERLTQADREYVQYQRERLAIADTLEGRFTETQPIQALEPAVQNIIDPFDTTEFFGASAGTPPPDTASEVSNEFVNSQIPQTEPAQTNPQQDVWDSILSNSHDMLSESYQQYQNIAGQEYTDQQIREMQDASLLARENLADEQTAAHEKALADAWQKVPMPEPFIQSGEQITSDIQQQVSRDIADQVPRNPGETAQNEQTVSNADVPQKGLVDTVKDTWSTFNDWWRNVALERSIPMPTPFEQSGEDLTAGIKGELENADGTKYLNDTPPPRDATYDDDIPYATRADEVNTAQPVPVPEQKGVLDTLKENWNNFNDWWRNVALERSIPTPTPYEQSGEDLTARIKTELENADGTKYANDTPPPRDATYDNDTSYATKENVAAEVERERQRMAELDEKMAGLEKRINGYNSALGGEKPPANLPASYRTLVNDQKLNAESQLAQMKIDQAQEKINSLSRNPDGTFKDVDTYGDLAMERLTQQDQLARVHAEQAERAKTLSSGENIDSVPKEELATRKRDLESTLKSIYGPDWKNSEAVTDPIKNWQNGKGEHGLETLALVSDYHKLASIEAAPEEKGLLAKVKEWYYGTPLESSQDQAEGDQRAGRPLPAPSETPGPVAEGPKTEPPAKEPPAKEPPAKVPSVEKAPPAKAPPRVPAKWEPKPPAQQPPAQKPSTQQPPSQRPPSQQPPGQQQPTGGGTPSPSGGGGFGGGGGGGGLMDILSKLMDGLSKLFGQKKTTPPTQPPVTPPITPPIIPVGTTTPYLPSIPPPVQPPETPPGTTTATTTPPKKSSAVVTLIANPSTLNVGGKTTLTWAAVNAIQCDLFGPTGILLGTGYPETKVISAPILVSSTFSVRCTAKNGDIVSAQTTVIVR